MKAAFKFTCSSRKIASAFKQKKKKKMYLLYMQLLILFISSIQLDSQSTVTESNSEEAKN